MAIRDKIRYYFIEESEIHIVIQLHYSYILNEKSLNPTLMETSIKVK